MYFCKDNITFEALIWPFLALVYAMCQFGLLFVVNPHKGLDVGYIKISISHVTQPVLMIKLNQFNICIHDNYKSNIYITTRTMTMSTH